MPVLRWGKLAPLLCDDCPQDGQVATWNASLGKWVATDLVASDGGGPHASTHQNNGSDEINVGGLSGVLADPQNPASHAHSESDVSGLTTDLAGKCSTSDARLSDARTPLAHGHTEADITGLVTDLSGKCSSTDPRLSDARTPTSHTHAESEVTNLTGDLTGKCSSTDPRLSDARTPTAHSHAQSDVTGLATTLAGKSDTSHTHSTYQLTSEKAQANGYASLGADGKVPAAQLPAGGGAIVGYVLNVQAASLAAPADAATYYFGSLASLAPQTTAGLAYFYMPKAGTIKVVEIWTRAATAGTAENISVYVRLNNTTDTLVQTVGAAAATRRFTNAALSIAVALGDRIEIKVVCPTWATNPATWAFGGSVYVE